MTVLEKVLQTLKPKAASLGFNENELKVAAEAISSKFENGEDATDEAVNAQIEAVIPFLQLAQSNATRIINAAKPKASKTPEEPIKGSEPNPKTETEPEWFKLFREQSEAKQAELQAKLSAFEMEKVSGSRKQKFETIIEKLREVTPKQYDEMSKDFDRLQSTFGSDEDFNSYITEKTHSVADIIQEFSEKGLKMTPPQSGRDVPEKDPMAEAIEAGTKEIEKQKS